MKPPTDNTKVISIIFGRAHRPSTLILVDDYQQEVYLDEGEHKTETDWSHVKHHEGFSKVIDIRDRSNPISYMDKIPKGMTCYQHDYIRCGQSMVSGSNKDYHLMESQDELIIIYKPTGQRRRVDLKLLFN